MCYPKQLSSEGQGPAVMLHCSELALGSCQEPDADSRLTSLSRAGFSRERPTGHLAQSTFLSELRVSSTITLQSKVGHSCPEKEPKACNRATYPGGSASRTCVASWGCCVPEPEAGSSASPGTAAAGRAAAVELLVALNATAGGEAVPTADRSSSVSVAPAESPFTRKAEGRNQHRGKGWLAATETPAPSWDPHSPMFRELAALCKGRDTSATGVGKISSQDLLLLPAPHLRRPGGMDTSLEWGCRGMMALPLQHPHSLGEFRQRAEISKMCWHTSGGAMDLRRASSAHCPALIQPAGAGLH